jgi:hypothetical protein
MHKEINMNKQDVSEDNRQKKTIWLNTITTKAGKSFLRSRNIKVNGVECQLRAHPIKKADGSLSLAVHFDPPYDPEAREVLEDM